MTIVVALGGNALLERGQLPDAAVQQHNVERAVAALAPLAAEHPLVITHGNGPQVGVLAAESAEDRTLSRPYPLASLGAETQGLIGYWLVQALRNALPDRQVVALVTQTIVAIDDPAFAHPTKFIGPRCSEREARALACERGWTFGLDRNARRRTVPSPEPLRIVELAAIELLLRAGTLVVCAGGGGVPVHVRDDGRMEGVEAVVDKDLTSALLAEALGAEALLLLTDVPGLQRDFGTPAASVIRSASIAELRAGDFPAGSMGPKVEAACRFAERTGHRAMIGSLNDAVALSRGDAGTVVCPATFR